MPEEEVDGISLGELWPGPLLQVPQHPSTQMPRTQWGGHTCFHPNPWESIALDGPFSNTLSPANPSHLRIWFCLSHLDPLAWQTPECWSLRTCGTVISDVRDVHADWMNRESHREEEGVFPLPLLSFLSCAHSLEGCCSESATELERPIPSSRTKSWANQ